jgi:hypothetical protein
MSKPITAAEEAASFLRHAEYGYKRTYGSVPIDKRIELANAWINLARIEAGQDPYSTTQGSNDNG